MVKTRTKATPEPVVEEPVGEEGTELTGRINHMHQAFADFILESRGVEVSPEQVFAVTSSRGAFRKSDSYLVGVKQARLEARENAANERLSREAERKIDAARKAEEKEQAAAEKAALAEEKAAERERLAEEKRISREQAAAERAATKAAAAAAAPAPVKGKGKGKAEAAPVTPITQKATRAKAKGKSPF